MFTGAVCGAAESREELVNEVFQVDEKYVRIDHIPARVCTRCGDETFSRETTEKVRLLVHGQAKPTNYIHATQEDAMSDLIDILGRFNRKERFFLVDEALGNRDFLLSGDFRKRLSEASKIPIPADAFVAMDYHLDWIAASLAYHANPNESDIFSNEDGIVKGSQEDSDLLVAFIKDGVYHLVFLEAKGYSGWSNNQMKSKAERLRLIFGDNGNKYPKVNPYFCMMSSSRPSLLNTDDWAAWMSKGGTPRWLPLSLPNDRSKVTRCDSDGKSSDSGGHFCIKRG